jgi:hypothetical protein
MLVIHFTRIVAGNTYFEQYKQPAYCHDAFAGRTHATYHSPFGFYIPHRKYAQDTAMVMRHFTPKIFYHYHKKHNDKRNRATVYLVRNSYARWLYLAFYGIGHKEIQSQACLI